MTPIVFGSLEASEIRKADQEVSVADTLVDFLRDLEFREYRKQLKELRDELRWARIIHDTGSVKRLELLVDYLEQELADTPTRDEEQAMLLRWNEWARGNPAMVRVYLPGESPFYQRLNLVKR